MDSVGSGGRFGNGSILGNRLGEGWEGGLISLKDMDYVGSGGRFGNGRANIYILEGKDILI